ncbi:thiopeptide-type bacteriocin biosynthesis protein [Streptomyces sp. NPDC059373]
MDLDSSAAEQAILAVLTGTPIVEAARWVRASPERLAEAVELYRDAGRATLDARPDSSGWQQTNIEFAYYPTADRVFRTYLLPPLRQAEDTGRIGSWWFIRKYPCWRLRLTPGPQALVEGMTKPIAEALDSAISRGVVKSWRPSSYEPETTAFGGPDGMHIAHALFHADSVGVLDYLQPTGTNSSGFLDPKATSLLVISLFLRAAGQEWSEQGDVWARVEMARPLPDDVPTERVTAMTGSLRKLLTIDTSSYAVSTLLAPLAEWTDAMTQGGQALGQAGREGRLGLGTRNILARHVIFHWNRMGFTTRQQAIWARAARETILGDSPCTGMMRSQLAR